MVLKDHAKIPNAEVLSRSLQLNWEKRDLKINKNISRFKQERWER